MDSTPTSSSAVPCNKIGIAIAVHNGAGVIGDCLEALKGAPFHVVLYDDGSVDGTVEVARQHWPGIVVVQGDGTAWWAGGTQAALERCFADDCAYALMLNPDARISPKDVLRLADRAAATGAITSALVVIHGKESHVAWPGARVKRHSRWFPIYIAKAICPIGSPVDVVGKDPYSTDEVHGRGVLMSREHFETLQGLDYRVFPHYCADNDFSIRARAAGIPLEIVPDARATLLDDRSGLHIVQESSLGIRLSRTWRFLVSRRHGEALRVIPRLYFRHLPISAALCSSIAHLGVGVRQRMSPAYGTRRDDAYASKSKVSCE